ncbi:MAG: molybdenum cofactor guanylyltransferase [Armatimonadota bacterium]
MNGSINNNSPWPHTAAILAGGESRRMGQPKEGVLLPNGTPMIARVISILQTVSPRVVIVGACRGFEIPDGVLHLPDLHPGEGPLAGLESLLASGLDDRYLLAGCDQPLLTPKLLGRLTGCEAEVCLFHTGNEQDFFPFPGIYSSSLLPLVRDALSAGRRSMKRLLEQAPVTRLPLSPAETSLLRSINTPDELAELHSTGESMVKNG